MSGRHKSGLVDPTSGGGDDAGRTALTGLARPSRVPRVEDMSTEQESHDAPSDEMKRKFREALDKKNAANRTGEAHLDGESVVHGAHGQAGRKREFRRKSG